MLLVAIATWQGPGTSADSILYLSSGISLAHGHGLVTLAGSSLTLFPPGLPFLAALGEWIGVGAEAMLRLVSIVSIGAIVALGSVMLMRIILNRTIAISATVLLAVSQVLFGVSKMAWSEPPFIAVTLVLLLVLGGVWERRAIVRSRRRVARRSLLDGVHAPLRRRVVDSARWHRAGARPVATRQSSGGPDRRLQRAESLDADRVDGAQPRDGRDVPRASRRVCRHTAQRRPQHLRDHRFVGPPGHEPVDALAGHGRCRDVALGPRWSCGPHLARRSPPAERRRQAPHRLTAAPVVLRPLRCHLSPLPGCLCADDLDQPG